MNRRTVIAMGSNLGDRMDYLQGGLDGLFDTPRISFLAVSPVYETAPVGGPEQPDYLNAVVIAETSMPAQAVLERCLSLEDAYGRARDERWGPRTLDLDLIIYGDEVSNGPGLTLPHPRAHERAFVLAPWHDADPQAQLPGRGPVADLLTALGTAGVARVEGAVLHPPA
ncbi:MAG TPA: 2-amino-4-hydroxy-6-hydroxymethyldihydropteridine diphosphokinase [Streptosporangiaceae bacterium]